MTNQEFKLLGNYHSAAEMYRDIEILMSDYDTAKEAVEHLLNGACVYSSAEMQELINSPGSRINEGMDEDELEENRAKYQAFFDGKKLSLDCWGRTVMNAETIFVDNEGELHKLSELIWDVRTLDKFCDKFALDYDDPESAELWGKVKKICETHEPLAGWSVAEIKADTYFIAYVL